MAGAYPVVGHESVLTDSPSQLVLEVTVPEYHLVTGLGGQRVLAGGFPNAEQTGAPDLPWYRFEVAGGPNAPAVSIEPEAWTDLPVPGGLAGVPHWLTPQKPEAAKDASLFSAAGNLQTQVSSLLHYRGLLLRNVGVSLGTYDGNSVHLLRRFRVRVSFSGAGARPHAGVEAWLQKAGVKNPVGGAYLTAFPRPQALPKSARAQYTLGNVLLKIHVGDKQIDGVGEDGMYALSYETAAAALPQQLVGVRIDNLRLYAGPNDTLRTDMDSTALPPTLREIPIEVDDNNRNGTFDAGDRIVFYGHGTSVWEPISGAQGAVQWQFSINPYSFDNYYYLDWSGGGVGATPPLRLAVDSTPAPGSPVSTAPFYLHAERDVATGSCDPSGRVDDETGFEWYWFWRGNCTTSPPPALTLTAGQLSSATVDSLPGYAGDSVRIGMFAFTAQQSAFQIWSRGKLLPQDTTPGIPGVWSIEPPLSGNSGNQLGLDSVVWSGANERFDGYTVRYLRQVAWSNQSRCVFPAATGRRIAYQVQSGAGVQCLKIENGVASKWLLVQNSGSDGIFSDSAGADVFYYLYQSPRTVGDTDLAVDAQPTNSGVIQNLWTGDGINPQYLIVAPQALLTQALALAAYRSDSKRPEPYVTAVVRTEDIYRDWSSGRLSPSAIRDLLAWALWHWGASGGPGNLQYVVLFGDGHYDYRNIRNASLTNSLPNFIPPFNRDPLETTYTSPWSNPMCTDNYYGVLDPSAQWSNGMLDVALGRISVQTADQAQAYVNKLSAYEDPGTSGDWRGRITLTADDVTQRGQADPVPNHTNQSEDLARTVSTAEPGIRAEKVYELDYPFNAAQLKPEATQTLIDWMNQGSLLVTFMGHGAYNQWTDEVLLQTNDALSRMHNSGMPFMVAEFSCTVGRFDKILDDGMNEQFVRQKDDGAIAGLGATRESYPGDNENLAAAWLARVFPPDTATAVTSIGMALQQAKNYVGPGLYENQQKYGLLGDPALLLHRNPLGITLGNVPDTLQALECGSFTGTIQGGSGSGFVHLRLVGSDILDSFPNPGVTTQYEIKHGPILFERTVAYQNHAFSMDFLLPKQVPFGDSAAKLQVFAWDAQQPLEASRAVTGLHILGTAAGSTACAVSQSSTGPAIILTGCNTKESGDVDFPAQVKISLPYCLQIEVSDSGGVMSGDGPDEGTTVELVGAFDPYHPNPTLDGLYQKTFQVSLLQNEMTPGDHLLKVTARDGFGNLSQRQVNLEVTADSVLRFVKVFNAPNPVKRSGTVFYFSTTLPQDQGQALTAANVDRVTFDLRIFDQNGHLVREFPNAPSDGLPWNGTDAWGQRLANGVYFYSVTASWDAANGAPGPGQQTSLRNILVLSR